MKIAVGSKNPVKINAVKTACQLVFKGQEIKVEGVSVPSGVSDQPMSDIEVIEGARTRAKAAMEKLGADFGFGIEGGACEMEGSWFLTGWVVVCNKDGVLGLASRGRIELPPKVAQELKKGERELGDIMDELVGQKNTKQNMGTEGILTNGLKSRTGDFEGPCVDALARFMSPQFYN